MKKTRIKNILFYFKHIGFIVLPAMLYFIPVEWLNQQHSICLFKNLFDIECYGCGITKAVIASIQLDFVRAFNYNKLIIIVMPLMIYLWVKEIVKSVKTLKN